VSFVKRKEVSFLQPPFADPTSRSRDAALLIHCVRYDRNQKGGKIAAFELSDASIEQAGRLIELGMSDIGLYYPLTPAQLPMFERIATDVLPALRAKHPSI